MRVKRNHRQLMPFLVWGILLVLGASVAWAGGTNGMFARMDRMVSQLEKSRQASPEEIEAWREEIGTLRRKVDERIQSRPGGLSRATDQDLFEEIDATAQPLLERYRYLK